RPKVTRRLRSTWPWRPRRWPQARGRCSSAPCKRLMAWVRRPPTPSSSPCRSMSWKASPHSGTPSAAGGRPTSRRCLPPEGFPAREPARLSSRGCPGLPPRFQVPPQGPALLAELPHEPADLGAAREVVELPDQGRTLGTVQARGQGRQEMLDHAVGVLLGES